MKALSLRFYNTLIVKHSASVIKQRCCWINMDTVLKFISGSKDATCTSDQGFKNGSYNGGSVVSVFLVGFLGRKAARGATFWGQTTGKEK